MYNRIKNYLTSLCIFALSTFSLFSALEIRELNRTYENMYTSTTALQSNIDELRKQILEMEIQKTSIEEEVESPLPEPEQEVVTKTSVDWDYEYVLRVVAAECRSEPFDGQMAVAQVIKERADARNMTPEEIVKEKNQFAKPISSDLITDSIREACDNVFLYGKKVTDKPIKYFYSTMGGFVSAGHEKRTYVMTIGYHKFFMD